MGSLHTFLSQATQLLILNFLFKGMEVLRQSQGMGGLIYIITLNIKKNRGYLATLKLPKYEE